MSSNTYLFVPNKERIMDDAVTEMVSAAKKSDPASEPIGIVFGSGPEVDSVCEKASHFVKEVWKVDGQSAAVPNAEMSRILLTRIVPNGSIIFLIHDHLGMDLAPGLSIKLKTPYLSDIVELEKANGQNILAVREEYSGQMRCHMACDISGGAVITIRSGSFEASNKENPTGYGAIIDKTPEAMAEGVPDCRRRFLEVIEAEAGDVDITKSDILVSVGRGIEDTENLGMAFDLAKAMGADVSCSRPVVDANWLEKYRQVGTSGRTVKPKVYIALGISGAFQHLAGIKGNPLIVAINKNEKAPIFNAASVGVVADILEFVPELTEKLSSLNE
mgnify:FL=1